MRRAGILALVAACGPSAPAEEPTVAPAPQPFERFMLPTAESPDLEPPPVLPSCDLDEVVATRMLPGTQDCGVVALDWGQYLSDVMASPTRRDVIDNLAEARACVLASLRAGQPFVLRIEEQGIDASLTTMFVGRSDIGGLAVERVTRSFDGIGNLRPERGDIELVRCAAVISGGCDAPADRDVCLRCDGRKALASCVP